MKRSTFDREIQKETYSLAVRGQLKSFLSCLDGDKTIQQTQNEGAVLDGLLCGGGG
jgi:hypothetical protein